MVRKHYVIIVGVEPGVYFAEWVEVAPLVKNYPGSIYQRADSEEVALRLFENARLKGQVRDLSLPPGPNTSLRSSASSGRGSSNSSASSTPHRKYTSAPRLTMSRSEAAARNGVSPTRSNFRDLNSGSATGGATTSLNRAMAISKAHSEPNPLISAFSSSIKQVYEQGYSTSDGAEASSCVGATSTRVRTRVESPSWLAPYPDDETTQSVSPALSPMVSPAISSWSFESNRPLRSSAPTSRYDGLAVEHMDDDSPELAKSPVPSFHWQEVRGGGSSGIDQATESKNTPTRGPSENPPYDEVALQRQGDIEPFVQLVVDEVLKRLRLSDRAKDESLSDRNSGRPSGSKRYNRNTENGSKKSDALSPGYPSQRSRPSPNSVEKDLLSTGVPNGSLLFDRCHDDLGPLVRNSPLKQSGLCCHGRGTVHEVRVDTSALDETGLHQPSFVPSHTYGAVEDPRSPLTHSKTLLSPFKFR